MKDLVLFFVGSVVGASALVMLLAVIVNWKNKA
jgi:hypothetical protein